MVITAPPTIAPTQRGAPVITLTMAAPAMSWAARITSEMMAINAAMTARTGGP